MHIALALIYGFTIYFACIAYALIVEGPAAWVAIAGPFIVSGAVVVLLALDWAVRRLAALFKKGRTA